MGSRIFYRKRELRIGDGYIFTGNEDGSKFMFNHVPEHTIVYRPGFKCVNPPKSKP
jgi:hypothetical protein